jgi:hypothetical protein
MGLNVARFYTDSPLVTNLNAHSNNRSWGLSIGSCIIARVSVKYCPTTFNPK